MTESSRKASRIERLQRSSFARQAKAYASSPSVTRPGLVEWLARLTDPPPEASVLDAACGTGHVTHSFAHRDCFVTGIDLTPEMLGAARDSLGAAIRSRIVLLCARVGALPFPDGTFDLCVCRSAFHHFADPLGTLSEMKRVTRRGGRVATLDHVTAEGKQDAEWHNRLERLRDPSHTACLSPFAWHDLYRRAGLNPDREEAASFEFNFNEWYDRAFQGPECKASLRQELLGHPSGGGSGMRVQSPEPLVLLFDFLALSARVG